MMWAMAVLGCITILLLIFFLIRWRWGQAKALAKNPLSKYIALSLVAHLLLAIGAYFAHLLEREDGGLGGPAVLVELGGTSDSNIATPQPWDPPVTPAPPMEAPDIPARQERDEPIQRPANRDEPDDHVELPAHVDSVIPSRSPPDPTPLDVPALDPLPAAELPQPPPLLEDPRQVATEPEPRTDEVVPRQSLETPDPKQEPSRLVQTPNTNDMATALADDEDAALEPVTKDLTDHAPAQRKMAELKPIPSATGAPIPRSTGPRLQPVNNPWRRPGQQRVPITTAATPRRGDGRPLPSIYRDRWASDRLSLVRGRGGSAETEQAVQQALQWLAGAQSPDGRWDASQYGSGQRSREGGHDRGQAGIEADTGITGLAMLAFLGAGHTHRDGTYQKTVAQALKYLLVTQRQRSDGSLIGNAGGFAAMYCHGIATLALSEAYSLTGDPALQEPVKRAVAFTLACQDPITGGWRYHPRQPGDTSQLGWQLMALTSAHYAGERIPSGVWSGAGRFLNSVAWGTHGGLSSYRPEGPASTPMTAEALLCRLFLKTSTDHPLVREASGALMRDLPGSGRVNYYYWYYGTLALYHLQNDHWDLWNRAVKSELLQRQSDHGAIAGSWNPDSVWGRSGGRVYTTALAALTLEVYYRYRPLGEPRRPERTAWRSR